MNRFLALFVLTVLASAAAPAMAEKADADKPTNLSAEQASYDDVKQVTTLTGEALITRGTLIMKAERVTMVEDAAGYQHTTSYAAPGKLATFRQKRDGGADLWIEGEAERIEYDSKTEVAKLFSHAKMRRLEGTRPTDEVEGEFISYDSRTEFVAVNNTPTGESKTGGGRIKMVIQPRNAGAPK